MCNGCNTNCNGCSALSNFLTGSNGCCNNGCGCNSFWNWNRSSCGCGCNNFWNWNRSSCGCGCNNTSLLNLLFGNTFSTTNNSGCGYSSCNNCENNNRNRNTCCRITREGNSVSLTCCNFHNRSSREGFSTFDSDDYYARQFGLNSRSGNSRSSCGCSCCNV